MKRLIAHCLYEPCRVLDYDPSIRPSYAQPYGETSDEKKINTDSIPFLSKFLILSAFLCQHNRPDHDVTLYTNRRREGGTRKKPRLPKKSFKEKDSSDGRSRACFPLERMLSVFSSIVGKYAVPETTGTANYNQEVIEYVSSLGSAPLFAALAELRDLGLLAVTGQDAMSELSLDSSAHKYHCSLSHDEAFTIADNVGFPLCQYLVSD